jgi:hypothetical protein
VQDSLTAKRTVAAAAGRFNLGHEVACGQPGERVALGADRKGEPFVVYAYGPSQTGIPAHAFATAITGLYSPEAIVGAFTEAGKLDKLAAAVIKAGAAAKLPPAQPKQ